MKTVITATGNNYEAPFDRRFGRAAWFCIYDDQNQEVSFHENGFADAGNGAGTKAAEKMVEMKVGKVLSGDFGPKAKDLLDKFDIQMVILQDDGTSVGDIIKRMQKLI